MFFFPVSTDVTFGYVEILASLSLISAFILLVILVIVDFRVRLLPNKYVFPFAALGLFFHLLTHFQILPLQEILIGGAVGYGLLWLIRALGSWYYRQEALGLGDVKLMGAAGLWLGLEDLMLALTLGACLSIVHGVTYAVLTKKSLRRLEIPAGPGLIGGIMVMMIWLVWKNLSVFFG